MQRMAIDVPSATYRQVKAAAALAGVNLSSYCAQALAEAVAPGRPDGQPKAA